MIRETHKASLWDTLWDSAIGGIAIVDRDGSFLRANPAFCKIVEYSEVELQSMKFADITTPGDADADKEMAAEVAAGKRKSYDMIKSYITKTNRLVWVHLRVVPFKVDGEFHYFISQVFEVPVSIIKQMGVHIPDGKNANGYILEQKETNKHHTWRVFKEWAPVVIMGLIGGAYAISQLAQHFPIG